MIKIFERLLTMPSRIAPKSLDGFFKKNIFSNDVVLLYRNSTELMMLNSYFNGWLHQAADDFDLFFKSRPCEWHVKKKVIGSDFPFLIYRVYLSERLRKKIPTILQAYISEGTYYYYFSTS